MLKFLAIPALAAMLTGPVAAQDLPGPIGPGPADPAAAAAAAAASVPDDLALRRAEPEAARTTASLKSQPETPRPWCARERRVGTGTGFCLIN